MQTRLPLDSSLASNFLVLSIRKEHVERIFNGSKKYELRKQLPRDGFKRVFLYESGGTGLVGYFDATAMLTQLDLTT